MKLVYKIGLTVIIFEGVFLSIVALAGWIANAPWGEIWQAFWVLQIFALFFIIVMSVIATAISWIWES